MTPAVRHYTERFRRERPDRPILDCYWSARSFVHFMATLNHDRKANAKRSRAAKRGWGKRRTKA